MSQLARNSDPSTSWDAAARSAAFAGSHRARIVNALRAGPMTAHELSRATGLTVVQIDRRMPELERDRVAEVVRDEGRDVVREGYRVWTLREEGIP